MKDDMTSAADRPFVSIVNHDDVGRFLDSTRYLHDCCVHRFVWENPMHVDISGKMIFPTVGFPGESNLTIYLQSQLTQSQTIELRMLGVQSLRCRGVGQSKDGIILDVQMEIGLSNVISIRLNPCDDFFAVEARSAEWRYRDDLIDELTISVTSVATNDKERYRFKSGGEHAPETKGTRPVATNGLAEMETLIAREVSRPCHSTCCCAPP